MEKILTICTGKYFARSDQDDINELDRYEKQLSYLKKHKYHMIGCYLKAFGNGHDLYKQCIENLVNKPILNYKEQFKRVCDGSNIAGCTIFAETNILKKFKPFKKEYGLAEDWYLYSILHKNNCKIGILNETLYNYRVHKKNNSMEYTSRKKLIPQFYEVIFRYFYIDTISKYKNVLFFKRLEEELIIKPIFNKYLSNINCKFVNEYNIKDFLVNEMENYNSKNTIIFIGTKFYNTLNPFIVNKEFVMYENLIPLMDCYFVK